MNGCLIRVILISLLLIIFASLILNHSDEIKEKVNKAKGVTKVFKKTIQYYDK